MKINHNDLETEFGAFANKFGFLATTCKTKIWDLNKIPNSKLEIINDRLHEIDSLVDDILTIVNTDDKQ